MMQISVDIVGSWFVSSWFYCSEKCWDTKYGWSVL